MSSRNVMPAGASFTPGFFTRPETEKVRRPFRPLRPWLAKDSGPFSTMSRTQNSVSTLLISVGRPNKPPRDGEGRLVPGQPPLALDRLEHRGLFTADVSAGAAAEMDPGLAREAGRLD